ncbi:MAG: helix-turn-helix domain-containing protein [Lachnospiraceae bacterium]|nr:helix-turn-helix domain-containing protein [Lachnospiraceae bacterium]
MPKYQWETPGEIALNLAKRAKRIRKRKKITQLQLASRSNVSYASLKRFEQTGEISLVSLIKIAVELGIADEIRSLFDSPVYSDISEVINDVK